MCVSKSNANDGGIAKKCAKNMRSEKLRRNVVLCVVFTTHHQASASYSSCVCSFLYYYYYYYFLSIFNCVIVTHDKIYGFPTFLCVSFISVVTGTQPQKRHPKKGVLLHWHAISKLNENSIKFLAMVNAHLC